MDFALIWSSMPLLLKGAGLTIAISAIALIFGIVFGTVFALIRMSPIKPLAAFGVAYIEIIRGTPLLAQIFLFFYGLPYVFQQAFDLPLNFNPVVAGTAILAINSSAYVAEIIRSGIQSIARGQTEASLSLGFTPTDTLRYIVLPQAFRRVIPPLLNEATTLLKNSSLLSTIMIVELVRVGQMITSRTYKPFEMYLAVGFLYLCMTIPMSIMAARIEKRWKVG
ncbi:amino acid ABC transporter permease [Deinococcus sp.]|uniref:amino acid ABC transporter permease n=1 Tax=Deinococcus sp. TaxID=47478 RepID=UPI0025C70CB7|nr:amino acid ABC transporter permease [Deinococcus sp.]